MSISIEYIEKQKFLFAKVSGKESYSNSLKYWKEVYNECRKRNYDRLLVEEALEGEISKSEVYSLNLELVELGLGNLSRIAFVDKFGDAQGHNNFGISVALSKGVKYVIFNSLEEAEEYLNK